MAPSRGMQDVELVDDDEPGPGVRSDAVARRPRGPRRRWLAALGFVVAVCVVVVVVQGAGRDDAPPDALALTPGHVSGLGPRSSEQWRVHEPNPWFLDVAGGSLLVMSTPSSKAPEVRARSLETGLLLWSRTLGEAGDSAWCTPTNPGDGATAGPVPAHPLVLCHVRRGATSDGRQPEGAYSVLDATTGAVVRGGRLQVTGSVAGSQQAVFVVSVSTDSVYLRREDLRAGASRWTIALPVDATIGSDGVITGSVVTVSRGVVIVGLEHEAFVVSLDGQLLVHWREQASGDELAAFSSQLEPLGDDRFAVSDFTPADPTTEVLRADGSRQGVVDGSRSTPFIDDGSASGLLLTDVDGARAAWDLGSLAKAWQATSPSGRFVVLGGRVIGPSGAGSVEARDVRTGEVRWAWPAKDRSAGAQDEASFVELVGTDGSALILSVMDGSGLRLEAVRIADGRTAWTLPVEGEATHTPQAVGGHVFVMDGDDLVLLG